MNRCQNLRRIVTLLLYLFCLMLVPALFGGCSSLMYFPAKDAYTDPAKFRHHPEEIFFKSADGTLLHGWYFKSTIRPAKATILHFHGNAQNITTHFFSLYWSLDEGFDYFIFDYRGYGLSEGKPFPKGVVEDGHAALDWINAHKDPKTKLIIFGQSLGGAIALRVACEANHPAQYDKLIVDSTFPSYRKIAQKVLSRSWITWPLQWVGWLVMSDAYAPKDCIGDISPIPMLVVHGTADTTVDYSQGERIYELAKSPKEFWQIEGGRHTDFLFREDFRLQKNFVEWVLNGPQQPEKVERITPLPTPPDDESSTDAKKEKR